MEYKIYMLYKVYVQKTNLFDDWIVGVMVYTLTLRLVICHRPPKSLIKWWEKDLLVSLSLSLCPSPLPLFLSLSSSLYLSLPLSLSLFLSLSLPTSLPLPLPLPLSLPLSLFLHQSFPLSFQVVWFLTSGCIISLSTFIHSSTTLMFLTCLVR